MSRYNAVVVEDSYRTDAISHFVSDLVDKEEWPGIVFVRTSDHAERLAERISAVMGAEVPVVTSLHLNKAARGQLAERLRARDPEVKVVVSTAVWSTGLDIPSLAWVLMAGAGRAPVGLKQASGRPTRLAAGKPAYTIYDLEDVDVDWAREQAAERREHYTVAGFAVGSRQPDELGPDAQRLARLLQLSMGDPAAGRGAKSPMTSTEKLLAVVFVGIGLLILLTVLFSMCGMI